MTLSRALEAIHIKMDIDDGILMNFEDIILNLLNHWKLLNNKNETATDDDQSDEVIEQLLELLK